MDNYKARSNQWDGEREFDLKTDNEVRVYEDFGNGSEIYILVPIIQGVANIPPLSRIYIHTPGGNPRKRSSRRKNNSKDGGKRSSRKRNGSKSPAPSPRGKQDRKLIAPKAAKSLFLSPGRTSFKPLDVYTRAYEKLENTDWKRVCEGLEELKGLILTDSDIILEKGSSLIPTLCELVGFKNKTVAKTAIACLGSLYDNHSRSQQFQVHLKQVIPVLVKKSAEKGKMLSEEAESSLVLIISGVSTRGQFDIIKYLLQLSQDEKSAVVIERSAHHLAFTVNISKATLIKDSTSSDNPLFDLVRGVGDMMYGKHENTRKKSREIITLLTQTALDQDCVPRFKQILDRNVFKKHLERVLNVVNEVDNPEQSEYVQARRKVEKLEITIKKPGRKNHGGRKKGKTKSAKSGRIKGSKVMDGVEAVYTDSADLKIDGRPEDVYQQVLINIDKGPENWKEAFATLNDLRYLVIHHSDMLKKDLKTLVPSLLIQLSNLRSSIQKNSLLCFDEFFRHFQTKMNKTLHLTVPMLIKYATDTNVFVKAAGNDTCDAMIEYSTPKNLIKELMVAVRQEKATALKERAAHCACGVLDRMGDTICQDKQRSILEDIVSTICPLMYDKSPTTRETASKLAGIVVDSVLATDREDNFKKIIEYKVPAKFANKIELILTKRRGMAGDEGKANPSKRRSASKPRRSKGKKSTKPKASKKGSRKGPNKESPISITPDLKTHSSNNLSLDQLCVDHNLGALQHVDDDTTF